MDIKDIEKDFFIYQIHLKKKGGDVLLDVSDLIWVEAAINYVKFHTATNTYTKKSSLKEWESKLDPTMFVRIHRSTIVSFHSIQSIEPHFDQEYIVVLSTGKVLRLSRSYLGQLPIIEKRLGYKKSV